MGTLHNPASHPAPPWTNLICLPVLSHMLHNSHTWILLLSNHARLLADSFRNRASDNRRPILICYFCHFAILKWAGTRIFWYHLDLCVAMKIVETVVTAILLQQSLGQSTYVLLLTECWYYVFLLISFLALTILAVSFGWSVHGPFLCFHWCQPTKTA